MEIKSIGLLVPLIVAVLAFTGGLFAGVFLEEEPINKNSKKIDGLNNKGLNNTENENIQINKEKKVNSTNITLYLQINYKNGTIDHYNMSTDAGNVYDVLIEAAENYDFQVEVTYYGQYGSYFIKKIGSKTNGEDGRYWSYYLNDQYGSLGANLQKVRDNDKIEWKFELSQF